MHWQLVLAGAALGMLLLAVVLMATGRIAGPAKAVDAWSAVRPGIPRRWLETAFWGSIALALVSCGMILGTAEGMLPARWNDVGQLLIWAALTVDAAFNGRRVMLALGIALLAFSGWQVAIGFQ